MKTSHLILAVLVTVVAGCSRSSADRARPHHADEGRRTEQRTSERPPTAQPSATNRPDERPLAAGIVIDPQIREVCQIQIEPETNVEFDASRPGADPVLVAVTTCLASGPLKDRRVDIVDHADANSTDRAQAVKDYFTGQGVASDKVMTHSAGDREARPLAASTPTEMMIERRVDVVLMPMP